jgi:hypothetical protein
VPFVTEPLTDIILYATPSGPLGDQIDAYLAHTLERYGANTAHGYPAHCTLTGFFHDVARSIPEYVAALDDATVEVGVAPRPLVRIDGLRTAGEWFGLELQSPWLIDLAAAFKRRAPCVARPDEVRLKTWLHLSLAYGFDAMYADDLALAASSIDVFAEVTWEVALWQRDGSIWKRH